jgi:hypothetical protein
MRFCKHILLSLLYMFILGTVPSYGTDTVGQWQEKTEIVWDEGAGKLVRRSFRIVDPHPELGLEFAWTPDSETGTRAGAISGSGELIWYRKGASPYDRTSRFSTYKGDLKDGRPDGLGMLSTRAGLTYDGEWKEGRMEGMGSIEYETGERYQGNFAAGEPDGTGTYTGVDGKVVAGGFPKKDFIQAAAVPVGPSPRLLSPSATPQASGTSGAVAQAGGTIAMNLYIDRAKNSDFQQADTEVASFAYDQKTAPDRVEIGLDAPEIISRWKGGGLITAGAFILDPNQFAPVFLVVDLINDTDRNAQIVDGYIDVAESTTDLQPYLEIFSLGYGPGVAKFDPSFTFLNEGWGPVGNAKITYSFGKEQQAGSQTFVTNIGSFDQSQPVSVLSGFIGAGVNVDRVENEHFTCASYEEVPQCLADLAQTGIFGQIGGAMFSDYTHVYTQVSGIVDYSWADSQGTEQQSQSPFTVTLPVLEFDVGSVAEYGAPEAIDRKLRTISLPLDRQNYRIPFNYRERLGAQQNKRFSLTLDAEKSSHHRFTVVLRLADGSTVSAQTVDLLFFKPRAAKLY